MKTTLSTLWILPLSFLLWGCETTTTVVVEESPIAADQVLRAARSAAISAGSLSAAIDTALKAHANAVDERNESLLEGGDFSLASRAESVAATSIRAVTVTIDETATRADALVGAAGDIPNQYETTLLPPLRVVSNFSNGIAEKSDELTSQAQTFLVAARNVHERATSVETAVTQINTNTVDALRVADSISVARNALDDALAEVVRADVQLTQVLEDIRLDAERLKNAARIFEQELPTALTPRRDIR